jgi:hypothetical protein
LGKRLSGLALGKEGFYLNDVGNLSQDLIQGVVQTLFEIALVSNAGARFGGHTKTRHGQNAPGGDSKQD